MSDTVKRFQCRHIFTEGGRCGSPCLRGEGFCYYHHTTRKPAQHPRARRSRQSAFDLPLPEDRAAIQCSIGEVLRRIAHNEIDPKRAGLLLYGLQIASINMPREAESRRDSKPIEEIVFDPGFGTLAPRAEISELKERQSSVEILLQKIARQQEIPGTSDSTSVVVSALEATADENKFRTPTIRATPKLQRRIKLSSTFHWKLLASLPMESPEPNKTEATGKMSPSGHLPNGSPEATNNEL